MRLNYGRFFLTIAAVILLDNNFLSKAKAGECPSDAMLKVASTCMPLQSTLPALLPLLSDFSQIQQKQGSFTPTDISKMREDADGLCKSSDALVSCLRLLQSCPNILSMIGSLAGGSRLPANLPELLNDALNLIVNMCLKKALSQYIDCLGRNNGVNVRQEYCSAYKDVPFGDFSASFSTIGSLMPNAKPSGGDASKTPGTLDCRQFTLLSGCMASSLKKVCNRDVADAMHIVAIVQGKVNKPPCPVPATIDAVETEYLKIAPNTPAKTPPNVVATAPAIRPTPAPAQGARGVPTVPSVVAVTAKTTIAPCPSDGIMQVMSKCMPLQSQMPALMSKMADMTKTQEKTSAFTSTEIAKMRESVNGLCQSSGALLGCLQLLQSCPSILSMAGSIAPSIKLPPNLSELIGDGIGLLTTNCVNKALSQFVDCIEQNNGINIKQQYCSTYRGPVVGDFSASFSSFTSLLPGNKPSGDGKPAQPLDCRQFPLYSGCMVSAIKKTCNPALAEAMYSTSKVQGKTNQPACQMPVNADTAAADYLKTVPQLGLRPSQKPGNTAVTVGTQRQPLQTQPPSFTWTEAKTTLAPCPSDGIMQVMSKCMPLQSQMPTLLSLMGEMTRLQNKTDAYTSSEIATMREKVNGLCQNTDVVLGCLRLLQSCPNIVGMVGSIAPSIKLPPNIGELIGYTVGVLTTNCVNKALLQYVECIGRNNGVNIKQKYCSAYKGPVVGDFSASFSSFTSLLPGSKPSGDGKPAEPLDCHQFPIYAGCMASAIKKTCNPDLAEAMYSTSKVQGKINQPPCQIPLNADAAEADYLKTAPQMGRPSLSSDNTAVTVATPRQPPQTQPPSFTWTEAKTTLAPCPSDGIMQVMSKCMPLQSQMPTLLSVMGEMTRLQNKTADYTSTEIATMREKVNGLCQNTDVVLGCLRLLQSCPNIVGMVGSIAPSIKLPPNIGELIGYTVGVLTTNCVNKALSQYVECIGQNNGINIKQKYCSAYKGPVVGDFSASFSSFTSLLPGSKPSGDGKPAEPLDCRQFPIYAGCMASAIKKTCNPALAEAMYATSKVQGKINQPACQMPTNADAAEADYLLASPQAQQTTPGPAVTLIPVPRQSPQPAPPGAATQPPKTVVEPCPSDGMMQVMSKCMPLQGQMPTLLNLMDDMTKTQNKTSAFTSSEIAKMRQSATGLCQSSEGLLGCLRLLQSCPNIINMVGSIAPSIKLPSNIGELISDSVGLLTTNCVTKALPQFVDCIERNNGINIRQQYCSAYKGPVVGDFSASFSSFTSLMPGSKPSGNGKASEPLDCRQFPIYSGCLASAIKKVCNPALAEAMYSTSKMQGKANQPPCQMPANADAAEAEYLKTVPQASAPQTPRPTPGSVITTCTTPRQAQTPRPSVTSSPVAKTTLAPCPSDGLMQVMSKCMPLQTQMPTLLGVMGDMTQIQQKTGAFTVSEIASLREKANSVCQNSDALLGCLRLLQSCPDIVGMVGSMGASIKLPPNIGELISDSVGLLTTMCTKKALSQYVECIGRSNGGVNIRQQYCSAYKGPVVGDFSASFSSFTSLIPGSKPSSKVAEPLDCSQFPLYSGCMVSAIKKICDRDLADAIYSVSKVQGKTNVPPCQLPTNADAAEAEYLKNVPGQPGSSASSDKPATPSNIQPPTTQRTTVTTAKTVTEPCPDDPLMKVMSTCLPLQNQMPSLLNVMADLTQLQSKSTSFTSTEIAKMREDAYAMCNNSNMLLSCFRIVQSCPSILSMVGSIAPNVKLPPNMPELIDDGIILLRTMCVNKALSQYVDCIEMNKGINFRYQTCNAYKGAPFGDFSPSFSSFTSLMPSGNKPPGDSGKSPEKLDCRQFSLFSGCMVSSVKKACNRGLAESMYLVSKIQGKANTPQCLLPDSSDAAEADFSSNNGSQNPQTAAPVTVPVRPPPCTPATSTTGESTITSAICETASPGQEGASVAPSAGGDESTSQVGTPRRPTTTLLDAVAIPISLYEWSDEDEAGHNSVAPSYKWRANNNIISSVFVSLLCLVLSYY